MPDDNSDPPQKSNGRVPDDKRIEHLVAYLQQALDDDPFCSRVLPILGSHELKRFWQFVLARVPECACTTHECRFWKWVLRDWDKRFLNFADFARQINKNPMYVTRLLPKAKQHFVCLTGLLLVDFIKNQ